MYFFVCLQALLKDLAWLKKLFLLHHVAEGDIDQNFLCDYFLHSIDGCC